MRVRLNSILDKRSPRTIIGRNKVCKTREVLVQVLLLYIGRTKGHKNK
jgi:hypothetical protein